MWCIALSVVSESINLEGANELAVGRKKKKKRGKKRKGKKKNGTGKGNSSVSASPKSQHTCN